nr:PREDICTED: putative fatty acyl-CoA reductase CG5065 [Megachile rotundata]
MINSVSLCMDLTNNYRSCPNISTLYLIVRPKKGKSPSDRLKENFDDAVYYKLKREQPNFLKKVILVEGDGLKDDLGWSPEIKQLLMNTNIIIHSAALVRFEEKLRVITSVNIKTIKFLLTFAKQLPNLKAFVHVSTAFAHCIHDTIEEKHYQDTIEADKLLTLLNILDDDKIAHMAPVLLDRWPNTYVFTKAVAENIVLKYSNDLPVCIIRPSIVIPTYKDPIVGWINNLYGATGVVMGSGIGLLRTLHCIPENVADIIPADFVVSTIISSAWDVANRNRQIKAAQDPNISNEEKVPIYNCVSSCDNPISWYEYMKKNELYGLDQPSVKVMWYYMLILNRHLFLHNLCNLFLHIIPAIIVDTIASLLGRKPMLLNAYRKINKFSNVIHYFSTRQWTFRNDNVVKLWQKMNAVDRKIFFFDMKSLDWEQYFYLHIRGLRVYMLNDSFDTIEDSVARFRKLYWLHQAVRTAVIVLGLWITVSLIRTLWSFCPLSH